VSADDKHDPRLLAMDTCGTMTDTFVVDESANYTVGKAQTTPDDESVCTTDSFADALGNWGVDPREYVCARTRRNTAKYTRRTRRRTPTGPSSSPSGSVPAVSHNSTSTQYRQAIRFCGTSSPTSIPSTKTGSVRRLPTSDSCSGSFGTAALGVPRVPFRRNPPRTRLLYEPGEGSGTRSAIPDTPQERLPFCPIDNLIVR